MIEAAPSASLGLGSISAVEVVEDVDLDLVIDNVELVADAELVMITVEFA